MRRIASRHKSRVRGTAQARSRFSAAAPRRVRLRARARRALFPRGRRGDLLGIPFPTKERPLSTIEQSIELDVPVQTAYNQWTQFEDFPRFMDGVEQVRQLDDRHLHWVAERSEERRVGKECRSRWS